MVMQKFKWFLNNMEFVLGGVCAGIMMILLFLQVVSRYVFNYSIAFTEELALIFFILSIYIGAVGATRRKQHLKIEFVINMFKPKGQLVTAFISNIAFMITNVFIIYGLVGVTANLKKYGMTAPITQIPKWIVYAVIPIVFVVITIRLIKDCTDIIYKINKLDVETKE